MTGGQAPLHGKFAPGNSSQYAVRDMKSLVNRQRIFLTSNRLNITASDLHAGLWRAVQEFGQGQGEV